MAAKVGMVVYPTPRLTSDSKATKSCLAQLPMPSWTLRALPLAPVSRGGPTNVS